MTYSNIILKYTLRAIFNYRSKTQMAKSDEINHTEAIRVRVLVRADRRTAPLVGYT